MVPSDKARRTVVHNTGIDHSYHNGTHYLQIEGDGLDTSSSKYLTSFHTIQY